MSRNGTARLMSLAIAISAAIAVAGDAAPAYGASFTVNATHDAVDASPGDGICADAGGACTLRAAVMETNALAGADEISLPAGTYALAIPGAGEDASATGDLDVTSDLTVSGTGLDVTIVDGGTIDRVLDLHGVVTVDLDNVTMRGGDTTGDFSFGGGIRNTSADLTVSSTLISGNTATMFGGGIFSGGNSKTTILTTSLTQNQAEDGGALFTVSGATIYVDGGSFYGNSATTAGGAIANGGFATLAISDTAIGGNSAQIGGGFANFGDAQLTGVEISGNASSSGGGIFNLGSLMLNGVALLGNTAANDGGGIHNGSEISTIPLRTEREDLSVPPSPASLSVNATVVSGNTANRFGGGLFNGFQDVMVLADSTVENNESNDSGGGLDNTGDLTISSSTIANNNSHFGAGFRNGGLLTLINSTVSGNIAMLPEGCESCSKSLGGGLLNTDTATLTSATFSGNVAEDGAGLYNNIFDAYISIMNTIVALNITGAGCSGPAITSLGHNLDSDGTCGLTGPGDISNTDPTLGSLADNGGPTLTHALLGGSLAIDTGDPAACPATDQRGVSRPADGNFDGSSVCDIGAYEANFACTCDPSPVVITPTPALPITLPPTGAAGADTGFPLTAGLAGLLAIAITAGAVALGRRSPRRS